MYPYVRDVSRAKASRVKSPPSYNIPSTRPKNVICVACKHKFYVPGNSRVGFSRNATIYVHVYICMYVYIYRFLRRHHTVEKIHAGVALPNSRDPSRMMRYVSCTTYVNNTKSESKNDCFPYYESDR